jgi:predicted nucleotidyltransferase
MGALFRFPQHISLPVPNHFFVSPATARLPEEVNTILDRAIPVIPKDQVIAIFLYGSVARGEEKPISDIDLCVVTERDISRAARERVLSHASPSLDITLFWDLPLPIRYRVLREGKLIWGEDGLALHRIRRATLRCYREIGRMLRRHERRVLDA